MWVLILTVPLTILGLNAFLAFAAWKLFAPRRKLQIAAAGTALAGTALFALALVGFVRRLHDSAFFGFAWEYFGHAFVPVSYLALLAAAGMLAGKFFPKTRRFKFHFAAISVALVALACGIGFWKFEHPRVTHLAWFPAQNRVEFFSEETEKRLAGTIDAAGAGTMDANGAAGAPTRKMRIVATADWHIGTRIDRSRAEKFVRLVNAQNPDVVLIAGDLIDGPIAPLENERIDEVLRALRAPFGVIATLGNHEYYGNLARDKKFIRISDIRLLLDGNALIDAGNGFKICFVGRDDATHRARKPAAKIVTAARTQLSAVEKTGVETEKTGAETNAGTQENSVAQRENASADAQKIPIFLLDHQPNGADEDVAAGADFVFCGHTHDGQFWPATWLVYLFNRYVNGLYFAAGTPIFVTSGIGLWHIPFRIGSSSELVVIDVF